MPRRYFQFGLRTALVAMTLVAVFLGWLAWEMKFIRERQAMLRWLAENNWEVVVLADAYPSDWQGWSSPHEEEQARREEAHFAIPFWRSWLGDEPVLLIILPDGSEHRGKKSEIRRLFPESIVGDVDEVMRMNYERWGDGAND